MNLYNHNNVQRLAVVLFKKWGTDEAVKRASFLAGGHPPIVVLLQEIIKKFSLYTSSYFC